MKKLNQLIYNLKNELEKNKLKIKQKIDYASEIRCNQAIKKNTTLIRNLMLAKEEILQEIKENNSSIEFFKLASGEKKKG